VQLIQYQLPQVKTPPIPKSEIPAFQKIVDDLVLGQNVFLVGGAGTGKTTLAQNVAQALGRQFMTINCSQWTAPTEIIGGQTLDGYQEGKLIEAWEKGLVLILDELPKIDPNTAGLLNDALAKSKIPGAIIFNSRKESFARHPSFAVIATGNVWPNRESLAYGANNKQDLSLLDRFAGAVYFIEKNPELEVKLVGSQILWAWCNELRRLVEELKYEGQVSLRFMLTCRDTLRLELSRLSAKGLKPDEGKTLADCFESFLTSNFTQVQQKTLREQFGKGLNDWNNYRYIKGEQYREGPLLKALLSELNIKSNKVNGLGTLSWE
jgi:energy-coupling factor transporter ATP-binding protein EcfA2